MKNLYTSAPHLAAAHLYREEELVRDEAQTVARQYFRKNSKMRDPETGEFVKFEEDVYPKTFQLLTETLGLPDKVFFNDLVSQLTRIAGEDLDFIPVDEGSAS